MTGLIDAPPAAAPAAVPRGLSTAPIIINLLPPEIVAAHRARTWRRRVIAALVVVLVLVAGADVMARRQAASARAETASVQSTLQALQRQEAAFDDVERTKAAAATLGIALTGLMTADLPWWRLLPAVLAAAPAGTTLTSVNGTLTAADTGLTGAEPAPLGDPTAIGTLKIVGAAPGKDSIAAFADALAEVRGLTNAYVTAVNATQASSYLFTVQVQILPLARGGRNTPATGR